MGLSLEQSPVMHTCFGLPLQTGVVLIALWGIIWGSLHVTAYSPHGVSSLKRMGVPDQVADGMRHFHYLIGVLLISLHVFLAVAAIKKSLAFCELYVWAMFVICAAVLVLAIAASTVCGLAGLGQMSVAFIGSGAALVLLAMYFNCVVANYSLTMP